MDATMMTTTTTTTDLVDLRELVPGIDAARIVGVSPGHLKYLVLTGLIATAYRHGRIWLYRRSDAVALAEWRKANGYTGKRGPRKNVATSQEMAATAAE
jgi:hypothetical protein